MEIEKFISSGQKDIYYLSSMFQIDLSQGKNLDENTINRILLYFIRTNNYFHQLRILNRDGKENIRVDFSNNKTKIYLKSELQSKGNRYYFQEAKNLQKGEIYLSNVDLNTENGIIEIPIVPTIRFVIGLYGKTKESSPQFFLVGNLNLSNLFQNIKKQEKVSQSKFYWINKAGYYLYHNDPNKTFGFLFPDKQDNLFQNNFKVNLDKFQTAMHAKINSSEGIFYSSKIQLLEEKNSLKEIKLINTYVSNSIFISNVPSNILIKYIYEKSYIYLIFIVITGIPMWFIFIFYLDKKTNEKLNIVKIKRMNNYLKKNQLKLQKGNFNLTQKNNQLKEFNQIISHNLRAPVVNLNMLTEILLEENKESEISKSLSKVSKGLSDLVDDLLNALKVINISELPIEDISIEKSLNKQILILDSKIRECKANVILENENWDFVKFERSYMESILYNLLINSMKFRSTDRELEIKVKTSIEDSYKIIYVTDNGTGLNLEKNGENLFKLYKRFHKNIPGKGLGLFMIKSQIDSLGGKIEVIENKDFGLTFKITIRE